MGALETAVAEMVAGHGAPPGAVLAVSLAGHRVVASRGVAQAYDDRGPLDRPPPMGPEVASDLGSVTKVVGTTTALLSLVAGGEVSLETPLRELLPLARDRWFGAATVEQLLRHRAGLWEWWPVYLEAGGREAALERVGELPQRYATDEGFHYSDLGFMLLGALVEAVTGRTLDAAVGIRVLEPLGLARVSYGAPVPELTVAASSNGDAIERQMVASGRPYPVPVDGGGFDRWRTHVLRGEVNDGNAFHAFGGVAGHAGLFAPASDLLRYAERLLSSLRGEGPLEASILRRFLAPGPDAGQALGFRLWPELGAAGHLGFPGVGVAVVPSLALAVAMVTNRLHVRGTPRPTDALFRTALEAARRLATEERTWT